MTITTGHKGEDVQTGDDQRFSLRRGIPRIRPIANLADRELLEERAVAQTLSCADVSYFEYSVTTEQFVSARLQTYRTDRAASIALLVATARYRPLCHDAISVRVLDQADEPGYRLRYFIGWCHRCTVLVATDRA